MSIGRFLVGVAAVIWNPKSGKYLLLRRAASKDFGAGMWECVTGRVDQGESFTQAFLREVREEVGGEARLEFFIGTEHFYRGHPSPENELLSLICACILADPEAIEMSDEHDAYRWLTAAEISQFLPADHWLLPAITRAEWLRTHLPEAVRASFWEHGLEISEQ
jgi:8-oxo-dGTP pyrophosphatase MutT (NUDIX family)